jgi:hypothetical protein
MNNDICFICYEDGYLIKLPCNNCNLFIHPLCLEKLINNFGRNCKVCKSNYNFSSEQIVYDNRIDDENNHFNEINIIDEINQINQIIANRTINLKKRLRACAVITIVLFALFIVIYYYTQIFY